MSHGVNSSCRGLHRVWGLELLKGGCLCGVYQGVLSGLPKAISGV